MSDFKTCEVKLHPELCWLCGFLVALGDEYRESPCEDDDGVRYTAVSHRQCIEEDERLGVSGDLYAEDRGGCMACLETLEDVVGEPVSAEYKAFRAIVDARPPLSPAKRQAVYIEHLLTGLRAAVARAEAAEGRAVKVEGMWTELRAKVTAEEDEADSDGHEGRDRWEALNDVGGWMDAAERAAEGGPK